jgi:predicted Zn finger-like uncharacterized protein
MIIQCKQCRTKFRFDDSNMQGGGIWLRCSRCGHVYFQENPNAKKPAPAPLPDMERDSTAVEEKYLPREEESTPLPETPSITRKDDRGKKAPDQAVETKSRGGADIDLTAEKNLEETTAPEGFEEIEKDTGDEQGKGFVKPKIEEITLPKSSGGTWKIVLWSILVIVVIPLFIYFFALPQYGEQLVNTGEHLFKKFNELRGAADTPTSGVFINQMVKLRDVRYRRINNYILGQIGVLEGTAENSAEYSLARIKVKGEIVDAYSVVLGERVSYAGNILTDEELTNLSEEEILMKLLQPEGLNHSNDKIMPNGQIPFMIVFPSEPSGVIKTTVMTIGAERLLAQ